MEHGIIDQGLNGYEKRRKMTIYRKAQQFVYRHARPIDLARWQYHFENRTQEDVLTCLAYYQNPDGGFGHALEPDAWDPLSTPIQTWAATEILWEISFSEREHPTVQGILRYLASGKDFDGHFWYNSVKSNNNFLHAPWWSTEKDTHGNENYNPTVSLAGFILRFADSSSELYKLGRRIAQEAIEQLLTGRRENDMHTLSCYIRLLDYCQATELDIELDALSAHLKKEVNQAITHEKEKWGVDYICKPSQFLKSTDSLFYADNSAIADFECEFIVKTQLEDGSWVIPWSWSAYPEEWAISQNWWKSQEVIGNLLYLHGISCL